MTTPNTSRISGKKETSGPHLVEYTTGYKVFHGLLSVATLLLFFATGYLGLQTKGLRDEIENTRASTSINLLLTVADKFGSGMPCAELLSDMSDEEMRDLFNLKRLEITSNHIDHLNSCFAVSEDNNDKRFIASKNNNKVSLSEHDSAYIVRKVTHDLNLLEIVAAAYYSGGSNKEIIKQTMDNLLTAKTFGIVINKINKNTNTKYYSKSLGRYMAESEGYVPEKDKGGVSK